MKKLNILFVLLFASAIIHVSAQSDFRKGYIITLEGDTVHGEIDYRGDKRMANLCTFRQGRDASKQEFTPNEIQAYRFVDSKYFVSKELNGKKYFFEYLIKGQLNIYYLRDEESKYYIEKEGVGFVDLPYESGIKLRENGREYAYKSEKYKGALTLFMKDAPDIQKDILKMSEPTHKSLVKIAEKYHNMVCDDEKCIVYEKKSRVKNSLELVGGMHILNKSTFPEELVKNNYFTGGVLLHLNAPTTDENLYFRTGLLCDRIEYFEANRKTGLYEAKNRYMLKVPLLFEYIYGKDTLIKPKIAGGINVYTDPLVCPLALSVGVNIRLAKSYYWSINYDIDFQSEYVFIPQHIFSHAFTTGLFYNF